MMTPAAVIHRLYAGPHRVHWTPQQIERVCSHYGVSVRDIVPFLPHERVGSKSEPNLRDAAPITKADSVHTFMASSPPIDRIDPRGWKLDNFRRNSIILRQHDPHMPVGKALFVRREGERLKVRGAMHRREL